MKNVFLLIISLILLIIFIIFFDKISFNNIIDSSELEKNNKIALYVDGVKTDKIPTTKLLYLDNYKCNTSISLEWQTYTKKLIVNNLSTTPFECTLRFITYSIYADGTGANTPELASNMVPIIHNGSAWVKANIMLPWYNYGNKEWANAVVVKENGTNSRDYYLNAPANTVVLEEDILMYYVWIPRYAYQIIEGYHTNTSTPVVSIKFLSDTTNKAKDGTTIYTDNATNTHHSLHPAFNFGGKQIRGFWVPKFQSNGTITSPCLTETCTTASITSKPNIAALRGNSISSIYYASRSMERYGNEYGFISNEVDTHMMKNTEWGAIAYLSISQYGKDTEIWINPNSAYKTGCAGGSVNASGTSGCVAYDTGNGPETSTTGNITGVYDMKGCAYEQVMGNFNNLLASSGIDPTIIPDKYIDRYEEAYSDNYYGDAMFETSASSSGNNSWFADNSVVVTTSNAWYRRGHIYSGAGAAGIFAFSASAGGTGTDMSFRPILMVGVD